MSSVSPPHLKRCPVCGVMMVAGYRDDEPREPDRFDCFNCGTVFTRTSSDDGAPDRGE
jgi:hypothetical protein